MRTRLLQRTWLFLAVAGAAAGSGMENDAADLARYRRLLDEPG